MDEENVDRIFIEKLVDLEYRVDELEKKLEKEETTVENDESVKEIEENSVENEHTGFESVVNSDVFLFVVALFLVAGVILFL